jgi:hypothetical protein
MGSNGDVLERLSRAAAFAESEGVVGSEALGFAADDMRE